MTVVAPAPETPPIPAHRSGAVGVDRWFRRSTLWAGLAVLAILGLIAYSTTVQAWPAFRHSGLGFFFGHTWDANTNTYGAFDFLWGTLLTAFLFSLAMFVTFEIAFDVIMPKGPLEAAFGY